MFKNLRSQTFFDLPKGVTREEPALTPALAQKLLAEFAGPAASRGQGGAPDALTCIRMLLPSLNGIFASTSLGSSHLCNQYAQQIPDCYLPCL